MVALVVAAVLASVATVDAYDCTVSNRGSFYNTCTLVWLAHRNSFGTSDLIASSAAMQLTS